MAAAKAKPAANGGMPQRIIDLKAARVARAEAKKQPVVVKCSDDLEISLPPEMPFEFLEIIGDGRLRDAINYLIDDEDAAAAFWAQRPSYDDVKFFCDTAAEAYGMTPGEPQASRTH
jgi:hypothetical protein